MARLGIGIAALASLGFLGWFVAMQMESPGLSIAAALIGMPLLLALFAFSKVKADGISKDGKGGGLAAAVIALGGVGYIATFFASWLLIACLWFALQIPMVVGIVATPTSES